MSHEYSNCLDSERDHIQVFIKTKRRVRYKQITERLGLRDDQVHYKEVYRTPEKAWDYCTDKKPVEESSCGMEDCPGGAECELCGEASTRHGCVGWTFGERPFDGRTKRGRELQLEPLLDAIKSGKSDRDILLDGELGRLAFLHNAGYRWAKRVLTAPLNTPDEWERRFVFVYHGPAGVGKSKRVRDECARHGTSLWVAPVGAAGAWYDGYDGQLCALFDDFTGGMSLRDLLNLLEGNYVQVPVKGSFVTWKPKLVYFTSDRPWQQWMFKKGVGNELVGLSEEEEAQLGRRISGQEFIPRTVPLNEALGMAPAVVGDSLPTGRGGGGHNTGSPPPPENSDFCQVFDLTEFE